MISREIKWYITMAAAQLVHAYTPAMHMREPFLTLNAGIIDHMIFREIKWYVTMAAAPQLSSYT